MPGLADFLNDQRDAILSELKARSRDTLAPYGLSDRALTDHLPDFLTELIQGLRNHTDPGPFVSSPSAQTHGKQRLRVGYALETVVREYGLLFDCIYLRLELMQLTPSLGELRVLTDLISSAIAESAAQYAEERQQLLHLQRKELLALFAQAPAFVCFLRGPTHVFELANAAYQQLVGHRDVIGKAVRDALPEVAGQGFFELLDQVYESGEPYVGRSVAMALHSTEGGVPSQAYLDFVYQPIRGEGQQVTGVLVLGQDVTELKRQEGHRAQAEAALRTAAERYRTLFESIDDGYCLMQMLRDEHGKTIDYRFLEANVAFELHTGLHDVIGKTALELVPGLEDSWFERYGHVADTGESMRFESHAGPMGDRWFDVYAHRVGRPEQRQVALVFKDISERKRAEQARDELLRLESVARRDAEAAGLLKDEFLATLSHELRTPLNAMLGWVHLLRTGRVAADKQPRALETIERNAQAQAKLIEDLLDLSRILAGKLRLQHEVVDLHEVVSASADTARPQAEARGIDLQLTLDSGCFVMGDNNRLQQVVSNLLTNALKFTPRGGRIALSLACGAAAAELTVADSGRGIRADFLPHVFERFRQQEGGSARAHGGLGLGLAIVRQLVELHEGEVSVSSPGEGLGTTFRVQLPLTALSAVASLAPSAPVVEALPDLAGLRVLVVDDEPDAREMLRELLQSCGAEVALSASAAEALEVIQQACPNLLLTDIGMPHEDGYALIARVRALPDARQRELPAIAVTAYARAEDRAQALMAGFSHHVSKPVAPVELLAVVASLLGRTGTG
jgi:PAS domain S-box-containing protein